MRRFVLWVVVLLVLFAIVTEPEGSAASAGRIGEGLSSAASNIGTFAFALFGEAPEGTTGDSGTSAERTRGPDTGASSSCEGTSGTAGRK